METITCQPEHIDIPIDNKNIRIAMLGNVDSGKSTTSGVLTSAPGSLDDGRGIMRSKVFNFQHEQQNGRTSSIAHEIMGFKADGTQYITKIAHTNRKNKIWPDIVQNSDKIIHLLDMCGHEKYLKTTMHGLTSLYPDYCLLIIGANMGISKMTKEHLACSLALDLPVFIVMTKIDIAPPEIFKQNLEKITTIMKKHCGKIPVKVKNIEDVDQIIQNIHNGKICPIFTISNTTGESIDYLRKFLSMLPKKGEEQQSNNETDQVQEQTESQIKHKFIIDSRYFAKGVGLILGGTVLRGSIKLNQEMMFGPDKQGNFKAVVVKGIHENRCEVAEAGEMSSICVNVKVIGKNAEPIKNNQIRKGSCLINPIVKIKGINPYQNLCVRYFDAQMKILHHSTTIQEGYQGVLHIGGVRQTVQAVKITRQPKKNDQTDSINHMRNGDSGIIRFKFKYGVELIEQNAKIMVREGNTKAFGFIKYIHPMNNPPKNLVDSYIKQDKKINKENQANRENLVV